MIDQTPTVVLVHGAFADASSWSGVVSRLLKLGVNVLAVENELRGGALDGARVADRVRAIDGPVLLVGHSYGGVVITEAAERADNVVGLVYITAFVLDKGETILGLASRYPSNGFGEALVPHQFSDETWLSLDTAKFPDVFAADLPAQSAAVLAVSQRPIAALAFEEGAGPAAWRRLPSHYLVCTEDEAIHPEAQRGMAERAASTTVEIPASHAASVSQPDAVTDLILTALNQA